MTVYMMFGKRKKNPTEQLILIKKNMKLTACIRIMISYVRKYSLYGFRKINTNLLYNHNSYNMYKKKININIASIFITLTEINNEIHDVAKEKKKKNKKQKPKQNCSDRIRTLSVNLQGS